MVRSCVIKWEKKEFAYLSRVNGMVSYIKDITKCLSIEEEDSDDELELLVDANEEADSSRDWQAH